jgi:hypothetical protein
VKVPHNEAYDSLQEEYLNTRNGRTLEKMYRIAREVSRNYLKGYCKRSGIWLNIDERSHDSAMYVIDKYLKNPEFRVKSLSAYVYYGFLKTTFVNKKTEIREVSYDEYTEHGWDMQMSILGKQL